MSLTDEDKQWIAAQLRAALDAAVQSIAADFSDLRAETRRRADNLERPFDIQAPTVIGISSRLTAVESQLLSLTRAIDSLLSSNSQHQGAFATIDRQFQETLKRIAELERQAAQWRQPPTTGS